MRKCAFRKRSPIAVYMLALFMISFGACKEKVVIVDDNDIPYYDEVPTVMVENYVNKIYIDLIGREPLNTEMDADVQYLKDNDLSETSRKSILERLQADTTHLAGDSSYMIAYYHRMYELQKARTLESVANDRLRQEIGITENAALLDSLTGDMVGYQKNMAIARKMRAVIESEEEYRLDSIGLDEMLARMLNNAIYDKINMNSFNFINAAFNDLFGRYPTQVEYNQAYQMVEFNTTGTLFQNSGTSKQDLIYILAQSREFYEGMIRWAYHTLLARDATTDEVSGLMNDYWFDRDFQKVQREIMSTDEYANF